MYVRINTTISKNLKREHGGQLKKLLPTSRSLPKYTATRHLRILNKQLGDGEALPLPAAQTKSYLPRMSVVPFFEQADEFVSFRRFCCFRHLSERQRRCHQRKITEILSKQKSKAIISWSFEVIALSPPPHTQTHKQYTGVYTHSIDPWPAPSLFLISEIKKTWLWNYVCPFSLF